jgi:hypothetical protein
MATAAERAADKTANLGEVFPFEDTIQHVIRPEWQFFGIVHPVSFVSAPTEIVERYIPILPIQVAPRNFADGRLQTVQDSPPHEAYAPRTPTPIDWTTHLRGTLEVMAQDTESNGTRELFVVSKVQTAIEGIGHSSCPLAQRPGKGVMLNP